MSGESNVLGFALAIKLLTMNSYTLKAFRHHRLKKIEFEKVLHSPSFKFKAMCFHLKRISVFFEALDTLRNNAQPPPSLIGEMSYSKMVAKTTKTTKTATNFKVILRHFSLHKVTKPTTEMNSVRHFDALH